MLLDNLTARLDERVSQTAVAEDAVRVRIGGTEVLVTLRAAGGDPQALDRPVPLDAALGGIEATCRAVLQKLTRAVPLDAHLAFTVASAAKAGSLLAMVTLSVLLEALKDAGLDLGDDDRRAFLETAAHDLVAYDALRTAHIPHDVAPPFAFSPLVPGLHVDRTPGPFRLSAAPAVVRPRALEDVAFWPVRDLAELVRTGQVTSVQLTRMYLARLHRYHARLNHVVTFLDDLAIAQARQADAEIAAGCYRGPLHGIPWGAKDIIAVKGYRTTWGSDGFTNQVFDYDATVVELLRDAGAVLVAKLTTGALAAGDMWFGGRTNNPWNPELSAGGSSAGSAAATAAGCVGFAIGTETAGSILTPAARCGVVGLRPTFGRVSRHGVMTVSWTLDRVGPLCRYAEDCAIVMQAIAKPDVRDMSAADVPFTWDAMRDIRTLRVGCLRASFDDLGDAERVNALQVLDTLRALGVSAFVPLTLPALQVTVDTLFVESAAFFDEMLRTGRIADGPQCCRHVGRLIPAVEYLQWQRLRAMMMRELADATADVDVYLVASNGLDDEGRDEAGTSRRVAASSAARQHATMANLAGYPAVSVPNGFTPAGMPTHVTFFARPFGEPALLALAKAYQDAAGFHRRRPIGRKSMGGVGDLGGHLGS